MGNGGRERKGKPGPEGSGTGSWSGWWRKTPGPRGKLTPVYLSDNMAGRQSQAGAVAAQAEVSNRRSIMSPTCSTRYLMYFSGFLVKGTLPYLTRR